MLSILSDLFPAVSNTVALRKCGGRLRRLTNWAFLCVCLQHRKCWRSSPMARKSTSGPWASSPTYCKFVVSFQRVVLFFKLRTLFVFFQFRTNVTLSWLGSFVVPSAVISFWRVCVILCAFKINWNLTRTCRVAASFCVEEKSKRIARFDKNWTEARVSIHERQSLICQHDKFSFVYIVIFCDEFSFSFAFLSMWLSWRSLVLF